MAFTTTRKNPEAVERSHADRLSGSLASGLSVVVAARIQELITFGLCYEDACKQASIEIFGNLQASITEASRGR